MNYYTMKLALNAIAKSKSKDLSKLCNAIAGIWENATDINWVGVYILDEQSDILYVGPFQGKIACANIKMNDGVCGKSAYEDRVIRVQDVHEFEGHIACDSASESEIVIPLKKDGKLWGVLDIDSPKKGRFTQDDEDELVKIAKVLEQCLI